MSNSWIFVGVGALICAGGVYLFYKTIFDEEKNIIKPILVILAGIFLIALGTAKYFQVA